MNKLTSSWLLVSVVLAVPFLGGARECEGTPPPPDPQPERCTSNDDCGADEYCNADACLGCGPDEICAAVCYGECVPIPSPELCLDSSDCGAGEYCNTDRCMGPPCGDDGDAHLTVCYGTCEPTPVCPAVTCEVLCEYGFERGEDGCPYCQCAPPPPPVCPDVLCDLYCEDGFQTDDEGCPICACAGPVCPPLPCDGICEFGSIPDENGCETCSCAPTPERVCGGFAGIPCAEGEYCDWDASVPACGAADHLGTCQPRPEVCIEVFSPVCGCDGRTYGNECFAAMAGTDAAGPGECASL